MRKNPEDDAPLLGPDPSDRIKVLRNSQSRSLGRPRRSGTFRSTLSKRSLHDTDAEQDAAFTIVVRKDGSGSDLPATDEEEHTAYIDISHDAVNEAVQDAVQDACGQAVQDAVQEVVQDAIQQAIEDNVRFDVRANFFTLIAITGVVLFWRGIWTLWDKMFGFSIWSELGSIGAGLVIMITFRLTGVPLLDGLPSG